MSWTRIHDNVRPVHLLQPCRLSGKPALPHKATPVFRDVPRFVANMGAKI
jgi:hypothetical protein